MRFNSNRILIAAMSLAAVMQGCIPEPIDIEIEPLPTKLVLQGSMLPDQTVAIHVSTTYPAVGSEAQGDDDVLSPDDLVVTTARVELYTPLDTVKLHHQGNGIYVSPVLESYPDMPYEVVVYDSVTDLRVSAVTYHKREVDVIKCEFVGAETKSRVGISFNVAIDDDPQVRNFFMMSAIKVQLDKSQGIDSVNPYSGNELRSVIFDDSKTVDGRYDDELFIESFSDEDTLLLSITNISPEYFEYLSLRKGSSNLYSELMREAIDYPSNVEGGYGIVEFFQPVLFLKIGNQSVFRISR